MDQLGVWLWVIGGGCPFNNGSSRDWNNCVNWTAGICPFGRSVIGGLRSIWDAKDSWHDFVARTTGLRYVKEKGLDLFSRLRSRKEASTCRSRWDSESSPFFPTVTSFYTFGFYTRRHSFIDVRVTSIDLFNCSVTASSCKKKTAFLR